MSHSKQKYLDILAEYFTIEPFYLDEPYRVKPNIRKLVEQPWQLNKAGRLDELVSILTSLSFIESKCQAGFVRELIEEQNSTLTLDKIPISNKRVLEDFTDFVRAKSHIISTRPYLTLQEAFNSSSDGTVSHAAEKLLDDPSNKGRAWFRLLNRPTYSPPNCRLSLFGHTGLVRNIKITRDGGKIVSVGEDNYIKVWDIDSGKSTFELNLNIEKTTGFALTSDGKQAVVIGEKNKLKILDFENNICYGNLYPAPEGKTFMSLSAGDQLLIIAGDKIHIRDFKLDKLIREIDPVSKVTGFAASDNGHTGISGHSDRSIRLWDLQTGEHRILQSFIPGEELDIFHVKIVAISSNGRIAASVSWEGQAAADGIKLWDTRTGNVISSKLIPHGVQAMAFTPDSKSIVIAEEDDLILWDVDSGNTQRGWSGNTGKIFDLAVTPDGNLAVSAGSSIREWVLPTIMPVNSENNKQVLQKILSGHQNRISVIEISPDLCQVLTGSEDGTARIWDLSSGECLSILNCCGPVSAAQWEENRRFILTASKTTIQVWRSGKLVRNLSRHTAPISQMVFSGSQSNIFAVCQNGIVVSWNILGIRWHIERTFLISKTPSKLMSLAGDAGPLAALGGDGLLCLYDPGYGNLRNPVCQPGLYPTALLVTKRNEVAIGYEDGKVEVWNGDLFGMKLRDFKLTDSRITALSMTKEGQFLAIAHSNGKVYVMDLVSGKPEYCLDRGNCPVSSVSVSPKGDMVITGSADGSARIFEISSSDSNSADRHTDAVIAAEILNRRHKGLTVSNDGTARLWSLETGKCENKVKGFFNGATKFLITPDNACSLTLARDESVRYWRIDDGKPGIIFSGHHELFRWGSFLGIRDIAITPDGKKLVGLIYSGSVKAWNILSGRLKWLRDFLRFEGPSSGEIVISPDGKYAAIGFYSDKYIQIRKISTGKRVTSFPVSSIICQLAFTPDAKSLVVQLYDGTLNVWDIRKKTLSVCLGGLDYINGFILTPEGRLILVENSSSILLWDLKLSHCILKIPINISQARVTSQDIRCSADSMILFSNLVPDELTVYCLETGRELASFHIKGTYPRYSVDAGGRKVIIGDARGNVDVLQIENISGFQTKMD